MDNILEFPNYIASDFAKYISEECKKFIDINAKPNYNREGDTVDISLTPQLKELDDKIHDLMKQIQSEVLTYRYKPQFDSADSGYEYHRYNPNQVCHYHSDGEVEKNTGFLRYASVVLHLTTNDDGGEIVFPLQNKKIKTEVGKLVIFPPYGTYGHYVTPSKTEREVLVSWFIYNNVRVTHEKNC
jgi:hypothetical protein